jgi:hypothetical protein
MPKRKPHFQYEGFATPNGTVVPDDVFDLLMPELTEAELRVLLYVVRRTLGFKKASDAISLSQMVKGIQTRDGRTLDRGTGMSRRGVMKGVAGLQAKGIVTVEKKMAEDGVNRVNVYRLRFRDEAKQGVGNEVPYGREPRASGVGNGIPPQQTALQQTVRQNNVDGRNAEKSNGRIDYLVAEIEKATGDDHSQAMFRQIAAALPDARIFQLLSEIKQGEGLRNKGAVFVAAAKKRLERREDRL